MPHWRRSPDSLVTFRVLWRLLALLFCLQVAFAGVAQEVSRSAVRTSEPDEAYTIRVPPEAIAYQRWGRVIGLSSTALHLMGLYLLLHCGGACRLRDTVYRWLRCSPPQYGHPPALRACALYFLLYSLVALTWRFPPTLARFGLEHAYGFSRQSLPGLLGDTLLSLLFGMALVPVLAGGYWLHWRLPRTGWVVAWLALLPLLVFQSLIYPVFIAPAYHRYTPLPAGELREQVMELARRAGIPDARILVEDTSRRTRHVNAYVTGIGPTARIVFNDTALRILPRDQLLAMTGHEIGHYVEGHLRVHLMAAAIGAGVFLWGAWRILPLCIRRYGPRWGVQHTYDLAGLPAVLLVLSGFLLLQSPLESALSRTLERRADAYGLRLTGLREATARLFVGFAERDYTDPDPPRWLHFWFGTHPPLKERIRFTLTFDASVR
ncbi:MAG: M48 family metalloprotease [Chloroherpetonaceae bacterium]|nr:M48 family metalloprotease [Chthonomonadaceae bacterium]MDW8207141.1 M48 family metalloprotease [Chloroherpetonaceae bacterium]